MKNNKGVSAIVATVFLIMITVAAVGIIWGTVIPFIKGNLDIDQREVDLKIVTDKGYTVYDPEDAIAFVQIERGNDNITLHGMELLIDFEGTTYKTTLRAPSPQQTKSYFFNMTAMNGKLPKTISVAPVFILDARQILGDITSRVNMPILNIVREYEDIILELEEMDEVEIVMNESVLEQSNLCDSFVGEDPWGGCPIAAGDIYSVRNYYGSIYFDLIENPSSWTGKEIKFRGENCIVSENVCTTIAAVGTDSSFFGTYSLGVDGNTINLVNGALLNQTLNNKCVGNNWFYIYDLGDC